jgi:hypothetical protein
MASEYKINEFYEKLRTDGARFQYQYRITVSKGGELDNLQFWATTATLPGKTITSTEIVYQGLTFRVPSTIAFTSPWTVSVRCDEQMKIYQAIEKWTNEFADPSKGGGGIKKVPDYNARVDLLAADLQKPLCTYIIEGIYPESYGDITLDTTAGDVATFDVAFALQYYYLESDGDPIQGGGGTTAGA